MMLVFLSGLGGKGADSPMVEEKPSPTGNKEANGMDRRVRSP